MGKENESNEDISNGIFLNKYISNLKVTPSNNVLTTAQDIADSLQGHMQRHLGSKAHESTHPLVTQTAEYQGQIHHQEMGTQYLHRAL